jgi:hypothetical protein
VWVYNFGVRIGDLIILTGASGAGKDSVMDGFLKNPHIQSLHLQKVVTCTDRPPRRGETDGRQYHFVTHEKLENMAKANELVEPITEIERLLNGENLVWRIDPSRAAEVAQGGFFKRLFPENARALQEHTIVLSVVAPRKEIEERRKARDLERYNLVEYKTRDLQERPYLEILEKKATSIENLNGKLDDAVASAVKSVINFHNSIQEDSAVYGGDELEADISSSFGGNRALKRRRCHDKVRH